MRLGGSVMRASETVARALATAYVQGRIGASTDDGPSDDCRIDTYVERRWKDHEPVARRMLRALKDQPLHVTDAGVGCYSMTGALNEILEVMARS
jgi:hypothetical protein